MSEFEQWYAREDVLYEIVKQLRGRETSFLSSTIFIRCVKAHAICFLVRNFKRYDFFKHQCNLYRTVASLYGMPMFSFNYLLKKEQQFWFIDNFTKYMIGYDFCVDFDGKDGIESARKECEELKELYDDAQVPYILKASGSGFHLEIPSLYLDLVALDPLEKVKACLRMGVKLKKVMVFRYLDDSIYDLRRVWKVAYSYDYKTGNIALPLTDEQFMSFKPQMLKPASIASVRNRGMLLRKHGLTIEELQQNVKVLFELFQ